MATNVKKVNFFQKVSNKYESAKSKRKNLIISLVALFLALVTTFCSTYSTNANKAYATSISDTDIYFTPGAGLYVSDLSLLMFRLNISSNGYENISDIEVDFATDDGTLENCSIDYTSLTVDDFDDYGSYYSTDVVVTVPDVSQNITLRATATDNSGATVTVESSARSILGILRSMNDAGAIEDYFEAMPNTLATVQKILEADESGYYLKAESGIYNNIFKWEYLGGDFIDPGDDGFYDSYENTVVPIDNANVIYRIKSQDGVYADVKFEFSFLHNNLAKSIFFTISNKIIVIENDISDVLPSLDFDYWANSEYYYFTFSFLDDLTEITTDLEVESWRTDIDVGMIASDTEYTNSLLAEIELLKAQYDAQVALVAEKETEIFNLKQRINELEQQVVDLQNEITELNTAHEAEIVELVAQYENMIVSLKSSISSLQTEKEILEEALTGDNAELVAKYEKLSSENTQLEKENAELKKKIESLKSDTEADNSLFLIIAGFALLAVCSYLMIPKKKR